MVSSTLGSPEMKSWLPVRAGVSPLLDDRLPVIGAGLKYEG